MRENLVVTSAYVRTYVRTNSGGGWGESQGECHPFLAGNSTVLLGNQRSKTFVQRCWSFKLEKKYLIFIYGKKNFKRILSCFFVKGEKLPSRSHLCCVQCCELSRHIVEFAAFGSGPDAKYSRASAFCFFFSVHNQGFYGGPNTFTQEKHMRFYLNRAANDKQLSSYWHEDQMLTLHA